MRNLRLFVLIMMFLGHSGFSISDEKADAWVKANPWFGPEIGMTEFAMKTHEKLVTEGADTSSDKYYSQIDDAMKNAYPKYFESDYYRSELLKGSLRKGFVTTCLPTITSQIERAKYRKD